MMGISIVIRILEMFWLEKDPTELLKLYFWTTDCTKLFLMSFGKTIPCYGELLLKEIWKRFEKHQKV